MCNFAFQMYCLLPVYHDRLNCPGHRKDLTLSSVVVFFVQQHIPFPVAVPLTPCWVFLSPKNLLTFIPPSIPSQHQANLSVSATAIIWDEMPMANKAAWECVDKLCHRVMNIYDKPFGGIPFIGLRDFRPFTLTTSIRSGDDPEYTSLVDDI
jgi:hypothetical protein